MKMKNVIRIALLSVAFVSGLAAPSAPVHADGGILVMPIRIMFRDRDRSANVTLVNTNVEDANFKIGTQPQIQKEDGGYDILKEAADPRTDLAPMLVFSPRQVMIPGSGKQRIRLALRRPPDLADGEYRTHLLMSNAGKGDAASGRRAAPGKLALALGMNVGYSIPVILRQGANDASASIGTPQFTTATSAQGDIPQIAVDLTRSGKFSTIGKVTVFLTAGGAPEEQIGVANNVNIFPELTKRHVVVNLTKNVSAGSLRIVYEGDGPDKGVTFDQKIFPIGN